MSYNGSGVYTLPGAQLANGATISATENNQFRNDVAAALNVAWTRDGQAPATGNIPMGTHKFTGLAAGTSNGDSVRYEQLPSPTNKLDLTTSVTGTLPVANGGSGAATLTGILKGNGTSAFSAAAAGTDYLAPAAIGTTVQGYAAELQGATQGGINGMKNRIINGAFVIDQRNAGASVTPASGAYTYTVDRFAGYASAASKYTVQRNAGSVTPPVGFTNYLGATSSSAYSVGTSDIFMLVQKIEGNNTADLGWGTANAQSVTLSFWVRSSLTGVFSGSITSISGSANYVFSYTINAANTWEQKTVTISGATSATWGSGTDGSLQVSFCIGAGSTYLVASSGSWDYTTSNKFGITGTTSVVGTNGATFYITGVQLEKGSTATSFDYRPYGTELALCQRYYQFNIANGAYATASTEASLNIAGQVQMRAAPTFTLFNGTNTLVDYGISVRNITSLASITGSSPNGMMVDCNCSSTTVSKPHALIGGAIAMSSEL